MEGRYYIAVNNTHPFWGKNSVDLKDLNGQLLFCSNIARTFETGMEIFQNAGISCNLLKLDEREVLFSAARKGLGGVFCMPMFEENKSVEMKQENSDPADRICFIPIRDCEVKASVTLVTRKDHYYTAENQDFIQFVTQRFLKNQIALNSDLEQRKIGHGID